MGCASCCRSMGSFFLQLLNFFTILGGLTLLGMGAYGYVNRESLAGTLGQDVTTVGPTMIGTMVSGGFVLLISCLGYCGAKHNSRSTITVYIVLMTILAILQLASGSFFLYSMSTLEEIATKNSHDFEGVVAKVNDFQLATYNYCCGTQYTAATEAVLCDKNICPGSTKCACIVDDEYYASWYDAEYLEPICHALSNVTLTHDDITAPVVGDPIGFGTQGACGNGDPKQFQGVVYTVFLVYGEPIGLTLLIICCIEFAAIICACCVCCCLPKSDIKGDDDDDEHVEDRLMEA